MNQVHFTLTFTGVVDLEGNSFSDSNGAAMAVSQLRDNLESVVALAVSDGLVTHNSEGTLDSHDYQIAINKASDPNRTFTYSFIRTDRDRVDALAILRLTALGHRIQSKEDAMETFEYTLTEWVQTTKEGFEAYEDSSRDFNIGDLAVLWPCAGLRLKLETAGLAIESLETVEPGQSQIFDHHPIEDDAIPKNGDEVFYKPRTGEEGEFVKIVSFGFPMAAVRGSDGQKFEVYPEELC